MALGWGAAVLPGIPFTNVAAGFEHQVAIRSDGTVYDWGAINGAPASASNIVSVAAGGSGYIIYRNHTVALKVDGTVLAWGDNDCGQATVPAGLTNIVAVAAGGMHSVALRDSGTVVVWGDNTYFQTNLPMMRITNSAFPSGHYVPLSNVTAVAAGYRHTLARMEDGTMTGWGNSPFSASWYNLTGVAAMAAAYDYNVVLGSNGSVLAGGNSISTILHSNGVAVAAGGDSSTSNHGLALLKDGTVYAWGANTYGQSTVPPGLSNVVAVAAERYSSFALRADGVIVCWGQVGTGVIRRDFTENGKPIDTLVALASSFYTLGLKADGSVTDWGGGASLPAGLTSIAAVAVGGGHCVALKNDGKVIGWGSNYYGQTNMEGWNNIIAIAAGPAYTLGLKSNGTVLAVGKPPYMPAPAGLSNVVSISALGWTPPIAQGAPLPGISLALKSDGTVVGWGDQLRLRDSAGWSPWRQAVIMVWRFKATAPWWGGDPTDMVKPRGCLQLVPHILPPGRS